MIFQQTSAPTGWTKDTSSVNERALRVVSGTAGSGGSVDFTTAFTSSRATSGASVSSHTLTTSQIPSHTHDTPNHTHTVAFDIGNTGQYLSNGFFESIKIHQKSDLAMTALNIDSDDADQQALVIDGEQTTADIFQIDGDALTTGSLAKFDDNSADTGTRNSVEIVQDNASAVAATALLVLLAAAARARRIRLGLLVRRRPGQCLGWVVADELLDPRQVAGREVVSLRRRQFVEPAGLLVVLGDASAVLVAKS